MDPISFPPDGWSECGVSAALTLRSRHQEDRLDERLEQWCCTLGIDSGKLRHCSCERAVDGLFQGPVSLLIGDDFDSEFDQFLCKVDETRLVGDGNKRAFYFHLRG